jgi:hypothetical protein
MLYCGPWSREAAGIYIGTARGNKENPSRTNRKGHGIARSNTRYVHNDISRDRGVTKLEADLGVRPQEVRCGGRSSNRQRGTSSRGAKAKAINSNDGALIVLATGIGTTLKIGKDSGRLRGSGQWNPDEQAAPQEEHQSFFQFNPSHFLFFQTRKITTVENGCLRALQVRTIVFEFFCVAHRNAAWLPKREIKFPQEFKQDGLLMLEFSNSQSCKEFTLEGEFYRRYTVWRFHAETRPRGSISMFIDVW